MTIFSTPPKSHCGPRHGLWRTFLTLPGAQIGARCRVRQGSRLTDWLFYSDVTDEKLTDGENQFCIVSK